MWQMPREEFNAYKKVHPEMKIGDYIVQIGGGQDVHAEGKMDEIVLYHGKQPCVFTNVQIIIGTGKWLFNPNLMGFFQANLTCRERSVVIKCFEHDDSAGPALVLHGTKTADTALYDVEFTAEPTVDGGYEPRTQDKRTSDTYVEAKRSFRGGRGGGELSQHVAAAEHTTRALDTNEVNDEKLRWHKKLGHNNGVSLGKTSRMTTDMPWLPISALVCKCEACLESKATTRPHPSISLEDVAKHVGDRIMVDLIGPIDPVGRDGEKYIVYCIDEYSRYGFVESVKSKREARKLVMSVVDDVERQGTVVREIHSDNAKELHSLEKALERKKIKLTHCVAYNHEGNAVVERHNRTLEEGVRTMLNGRHVDQKF